MPTKNKPNTKKATTKLSPCSLSSLQAIKDLTRKSWTQLPLIQPYCNPSIINEHQFFKYIFITLTPRLNSYTMTSQIYNKIILNQTAHSLVRHIPFIFSARLPTYAESHTSHPTSTSSNITNTQMIALPELFFQTKFFIITNTTNQTNKLISLVCTASNNSYTTNYLQIYNKISIEPNSSQLVYQFPSICI